MSAFTFSKVHKSTICQGDTILHNGKEMTVCVNDIKRCEFMGLTIFGDSYMSGSKPVIKGKLKNGRIN